MVVDNPATEAELDRIFRALADVTRRDILRRALRGGESVSALSRHYSMSLPAVQKHVAVLERAALITKERRGRERIVHADGSAISKAVALLDQYEAMWIDRVDQMVAILAANEGGQP
jgi:DNA-binding transcriptional ArsR family regulator